MQIVSSANNLHEMSNMFNGKIRKKYFKMSSAGNITQSFKR